MRRYGTSRFSKVEAANGDGRVVGKLMNNIQKVTSISLGRDFEGREGVVDSVDFATSGARSIGTTIFTCEKTLFIFIETSKVLIPKFNHAVMKDGDGTVIVTPILL